MQDETDAAQLIGIIMRKQVSKVLSLSVALMFFSAAAGNAQVQSESDVLTLSCKGYATTTADRAAREIYQRAGALATTQPGKILVIAAGRKFYMPAQQIDADTLAPISVYERMRAWNEAYNDAYRHCRHANNITIEVRQ